MSRKQTSSAKTTANPTKPRTRSAKTARPTPQPETVQRYEGEAICAIGFPKATEEALGPELMKSVVEDLNKMGLLIVFQDERCVINLTTYILATRA